MFNFSKISMPIIISGLLFSSTVNANTLYNLTDLGSNIGTAINSSGQVTGINLSSNNPFLFSNGVINVIGSLGGNAWGNDINDSGQITGESYLVGNVKTHSFLYSNGVMSDLGTLNGGTATKSWGAGINNSGQIAGTSYLADAVSHAFTYSNGVMTDIGTLGGTESWGYDINNSGQVLGASYPTGSSYSPTGNTVSHAFIYSNNVMTDIGTLGGNYSLGLRINDSGQVTGISSTQINNDNKTYAFIYSNGVMTDLGTLGGTGSGGDGLNSLGEVVGWSQITGDSALHAFIYSNGVVQDLNTLMALSISGLVLNHATDINDSGQIVVSGMLNGNQHGFILTPVNLTSVPIPTTIWLFFSGIGLISFGFKKRINGVSK